MAVYQEPVYEEPTLIPRKKKYERVLFPLMDTPGTWAKIGEYKTEGSAYQASINLRNGKYQIPTDPSEWEFVAEDNEVFARYVKDGVKNEEKDEE